MNSPTSPVPSPHSLTRACCLSLILYRTNTVCCLLFFNAVSVYSVVFSSIIICTLFSSHNNSCFSYHCTLFSQKQTKYFTQNRYPGQAVGDGSDGVGACRDAQELSEYFVQNLHIQCSKCVCKMHISNITYRVLHHSCIIIDLTLPTAYPNVTRSQRGHDTQCMGDVCVPCA